MFKTGIVLLPVDNFDRTDDAENNQNKEFDNISDAFDFFDRDKGVLIYTDLNEFMDDCNDEQLSLETNWVTVIKFK